MRSTSLPILIKIGDRKPHVFCLCQPKSLSDFDKNVARTFQATVQFAGMEPWAPTANFPGWVTFNFHLE